MAKIVLTDAYVEIGATLAGNAAEVSIDVGVDAPEATTFSTGGWRSYLPGLKQWSGSVSVMNDFAASAVDSDIWALLGSTASFAFRSDSASVGASNPSYEGTIIITGFSPVGQSVGEVASASISFQGTSTLSRATS